MLWRPPALSLGGDVELTPAQVFNPQSYTGNSLAGRIVAHGLTTPTETGLMAWFKRRGASADWHLFNSAWDKRFTHSLTQEPVASVADATITTDFGNTNIELGTNVKVNTSGSSYMLYAARQAPSFMRMAHVTVPSGGSVEIDCSDLGTIGFVMAKRWTAAEDWQTWHRTRGNTHNQPLSAVSESTTRPIQVTDTTVSLVSSLGAGTGEWIVFIFAHNTKYVHCGSYTGNANTTGPIITGVGFSPRFLLIKHATGSGAWIVVDSIRALNNSYLLLDNTSAEVALAVAVGNSDGFQISTNNANVNSGSTTYRFMAIA